MGRKKQITENDRIIDKTEFCTECGDELTHFHLSRSDKNEVQNNFEHCKKNGKFKGERCSKLYIIGDDETFIDENQ